MIDRPHLKPLGECLIEAGHLTTDQLRVALHDQRSNPRRLGRILTDMGFIGERALLETLSKTLARPAVDLWKRPISQEALDALPKELARRHRILPLAFDRIRRHLEIAVSNPHDLTALASIKATLGDEISIETRLASEQALDHALEHHYGQDDAIQQLLHSTEAPPAVPHDTVAVRMIDHLLREALYQGASDLHFEPDANCLRIRYRIDGLLRPMHLLHASLWPAMSIRLKVLGGLNIAETRLAQDGQCAMRQAGLDAEFRIACMPTLHGESIVLRIIDKHRQHPALDTLGLSAGELSELKRLLQRPEGMLLVTGPTGSGKSSTLYAALAHLKDPSVSIMTLEDPVEHTLPGIRQTALGESAKLDFASGIRALLRQDPDILMIGEIRDSETAQMAFRAALTGHLVLSTLHAGATTAALPRLYDLGVSGETLANSLTGILAQRLLRQLCSHCTKPRTPTPAEQARFITAGIQPPQAVYSAGQCPQCAQQGYRGRRAILEILAMDPQLSALISQQAGLSAIRQHAAKSGMVTLEQRALQCAAAGHTTLEEVERVIGPPCGFATAP